MSETPYVDAAVRAGCDAGGRDGSACQYRPCVTRGAAGELCRDHYRQSIGTLRAAFPWTPNDETVEAMARELYREGYRPHEELSDLNIETTFSTTEHDGDCTKKCYTCLLCEAEPARRQALAAYRAIPIVRELWPEEVR